LLSASSVPANLTANVPSPPLAELLVDWLETPATQPAGPYPVQAQDDDPALDDLPRKTA